METIDYAKVKRQLWASAYASKNHLRGLLSAHIVNVYIHLEMKNTLGAEMAMDKFDITAGELGWNGRPERLPRPFDKKHLERLYWQASKMLGRGGMPLRHYKPPRKERWERD